MIKEKLLEIRKEIDVLVNNLENDELSYITTMEDEIGKYELWLLPKSISKTLNWWDAIKHCNELGGSLPTIEELDYLYIHTDKLGDSTYWSSTEVSASNSFVKYFFSGLRRSLIKTQFYHVRAVKRIRFQTSHLNQGESYD